MNELEIKKQKLATSIKWGLGIAAVIVFVPAIYLLIKGLVGLVVAGVLGLTIVSGAPWLSMKFANWKLQAIKHEARTNPIESLQNVFEERLRGKAVFKARITDFETEVNNFTEKVGQFKIQFPQDSEKFESQLAKMNQLLDSRWKRYEVLKKELTQFEAEIGRASAIWDMSLAAQRLNNAAGFDDADFLQKIKTETSLDSVQSNLNRAFAEMESELRDEPLLLEKQVEGQILSQTVLSPALVESKLT